MACVTYRVVKDGTAWKVRDDGRERAYATQREATKAAIALAERAVKAGQDAQVLISKLDGTWHTEWSAFSHRK